MAVPIWAALKRLREGRTSRGIPILGQLPGVGRLFKNVGIGRETSNSGAHVNAYIIDLKEQEEALLANASPQARRAMRDPRFAAEYTKQANFISRNVARHTPTFKTKRLPDGRLVHSRPLTRDKRRLAKPSVADVRRQNDLARSKQTSDAVRFLEKGQEAEAAGKASVAKIFYQMAARRAKGTDLYDQVATRLDALTAKLKLAKR